MKTIKEALEPLVNLPTEFAEEKYIGKTCMICGFPFSKETRKRMVSQALSQIKQILLKSLPKEDYKVILEKDSYGDGRVDGYNQALADIKKIMADY